MVGCGILVACATIFWNRRIARLKATLDLIEGSESKEFYQERYAAFREYRKDANNRRAILAEKRDFETQQKRDMCLDFLNHYELVSIACERGIIDRKFYREWMGEVFVRDWNAAHELIRSARVPENGEDKASKEAFSEFEKLAKNWGGKALP